MTTDAKAADAQDTTAELDALLADAEAMNAGPESMQPPPGEPPGAGDSEGEYIPRGDRPQSQESVRDQMAGKLAGIVMGIGMALETTRGEHWKFSEPAVMDWSGDAADVLALMVPADGPGSPVTALILSSLILAGPPLAVEYAISQEKKKAKEQGKDKPDQPQRPEDTGGDKPKRKAKPTSNIVDD